MNGTADVTISAPGINPNFGISVSSAGDINKDGFSDMLVGSFDNPPIGSPSVIGKAFIYFGGLSMNSTEDITLPGSNPSDLFGYALSEAGDLNGDGNIDLIVSELGYNSNIGRTSIYFTITPNVKPNLISIKDVPNDQGGFVKLKWVKSTFDVPVIGTITSYLIERSVPPANNGYQWEQIGTVMPTLDNLYYYYTCSTPADSGVNGNSTFHFRITAYAGTSTFYRSNILSGNSIDNLAPVQVQAFAAHAGSNNVRLTWLRNHESDLQNYLIYRSTSPTININTEPVFASTYDSTFLDTNPLAGTYYFIVAQDIHNNKSPAVSPGNQGITINLTASIEGFYNSSANTQISDTIKVYLRNVNSPHLVVDSARSVLNSNGNAVLNFGNASSGQYYIVITHRNALETWSKSGGELLSTSGTVNYDMSDLSSKAFGNNIKQIDHTPVRFGFYSGDVNHDRVIDLTDLILVYNDVKNFNSGYINSDINGDNITDLSDLLITYNNSVNFVSVIRP
ncbi:MAG: hypothetical protein IPL53_19475 [Ignavibacteria bacterium]|nr:hypothetical protein [Ignavibacteria bacterium]